MAGRRVRRRLWRILRRSPGSLADRDLGHGTAGVTAQISTIKNVLATIVNAIASVVFVIVSEVNWPAAIAIAVGSVLGAQSMVGRKLPPTSIG